MAGFYGIDESEHEFLRCVDPITNGIIYCVNKIHLEKDGWCKKWISNDIHIIDVRKVKPFQSNAFTHDSMVDRNKTSKFVDMLIDFACLIHANLKRFGKVIVHCKNGRSRSPTVILAFMMLRGLSKEHATSWLTTAFRSQRITIASRSVEFPNFPKFESVISALAIRCSTESSRLEIDKRVKHNFNTFSSTSSSSSSSSLNHLNGLPFSGSWLVPERLKGKLPSTSFCSAPSTMSSSKSDTSSATKGGRTSKRVSIKNAAVVSPAIHILGRRVKLVGTNKVGTLVEKIGSSSDNERWRIDFNDRTSSISLSSEIVSAFPKGTRV